VSGGVYAIGDSVMQGAGPDLYGTLPAQVPGIEVDAVPYRQLRQAAPIVGERLACGPHVDGVVIHLGTNGLFAPAAFDELMAVTRDVPTVVLVNVKAPREWEPAVNDRLAAGVDGHPNAHLLDWWTIATASPEYVCRDGFHLTRQGAGVYAAAIARSIAAASAIIEVATAGSVPRLTTPF
jgi:lysophospholipase L1-like esterase